MGSIDIDLSVTAPEWVFYSLAALLAALTVSEVVGIYADWIQIKKLRKTK